MSVPFPRVRAAAALVAVAASCAGSGTSSTLKLTCGTYNAGQTGGLVLAAVIDPPPRSEVALEVSQGGRQVTMTCREGERLCIATLPSITTWETYLDPSESVVRWNLGDGPRSATCSLSTMSFPTVLAQPEGKAEVVGAELRVTWAPVDGARTYVATFRDLGPPGEGPQRVLGRMATRELHAEFRLPRRRTPELAVVEVEAWALDPDAFTGEAVEDANRSVRAIPVVGAPWALKQPPDFVEGALALSVPAGSRMALILLNVDGNYPVRAHVQATGTGPVEATRPAEAAASLRPAARAEVTRPRKGTSRVTPAPSATRTFCTILGPRVPLNVGAPQQQPAPRPAMLLLETGSTLLYVDDEDVSGFTDADLDELAAWWEKAAASVVARSGPLPDVDGNGKFIIFFTHALGPRSWCLASAPDVWYPAGTCDPADTSGWTWSNGADMIHLHPPFGMEDDLGRPLPVEAQWAVVKGQMPFALQRMVDAARFGRTPPAPFATEIKHARMALAATLAGSGDHVESLRALAAPALLTRGGLRGSGPYPEGGYPEIEIFPFNWDAPHQEAARAAADTFLLYFADRLGAEFVQRFLDTGVGIRQFEVVSGIPFPIAFALWTGALLFSNEPASPWRGFDYTGTTGTDWAPGDPLPETSDWTPFHEKFQRFEYAPLEAGDPLAVNLPHVNSFDVLVTGVAGPGGGTVTVSMEEMLVGLLPRSPYVLAIPFQGSLP